ncbi:hypothetical protein Dimus_003766, partial [Dionaea muscipula]
MADEKDDSGKDDDDDDHVGNHQTDQEKVQTPSVNTTEVIEDADDEDDDVVDSSGHAFDYAQEDDDEQHDGRDDAERHKAVESTGEEVVADVHQDAEEKVEHDNDDDNMQLCSSFEALRRGYINDDDILLSHKYQATLQSLEADKDMEVVDITPRVLEMDDNTAIFMSTDGVVCGINDMDALADVAIEDAANKLIEDAADKIELRFIA